MRDEMKRDRDALRRVIVGLADLVRDAHTHGMTARFSQRAPILLEEARASLGGEAMPVAFTSAEAQRQAFEKWFTRDDTPAMAARAIERKADGDYKLMQAYQAWTAWKAAREIPDS